MKLKNKNKSFEIIKSGIHEIDPYCLLKGGAPDDEFDSEINSIVKQLHKCYNPKDLAQIIAQILSSSFGEEFDHNLYISFAIDMFNSLKSNKIL